MTIRQKQLFHGALRLEVNFLSILNKAKKKTEDAAKKAAEGTKNVAQKTGEEAKKAGRKVRGK